MRIVIIGDRSRYQFLRYLVKLSKDAMYTEDIWNEEIYVSSKNTDIKNTLFSPLIPLNSTLLFPKEYDNDILFDENDKILYFNEFPYNREEDIEKLQEIISSDKKGQFQVILVKNQREGMDTDISTDDMAIESAERILKEMNVSYCKYEMFQIPYFLFWKLEKGQYFENYKFRPLLDQAKNDLAIFDSLYDWSYDLNIATMLDDPSIRKNIFRYDSSLQNKNVWQIYRFRSYKSFLKNNVVIEQFYLELYKNTVCSIAIWDIKKDIAKLKKNIKTEFDQKFNALNEISFSGDEVEYDSFLNRNRIIITLNNLLITFFKEDLKKIIKLRIYRDIERMEELINECNS